MLSVRRWQLWKIVVAITYAAWNLAAWAVSQPQEFGDTYRYFGSTLFDIQNPGITTVFLYTTVESPRLVTLIQVLLSIAAWLTFAALIQKRLGESWASWMLPLLALLLSMTAPLWSWHLLLGSESLAISSAVIWIASLLAVRHYRSALTLALNTCASGILLVTRPQLFPVVLSVELIALVWRSREAHRTLGSVLGYTGVLTFAAWAVIRLRLLAENDVFRYRYAIDNVVDKRDSFGRYVEQNMPPCTPLSNALNGPRPWDDVWQIKEKLIGLCPESFLWLRSPSTQLTSWSTAIPADALNNFIGAILAVSLPIYAPKAQAMPSSLSSLLFPDWDMWKLVAIYALLGMAIAWSVGVRIRVSLLWLLSAVLILLGVLSFLFAVWGADGIELNRHLMPLTGLLPIVAVVMPTALGYRTRAVATDRAKASHEGTPSGDS